MDTRNSQLEFYLDLAVCTVSQNPRSLSSAKDLAMDLRTLRSRAHSEGLSFLTKTLPVLGRAFDKGLESGTLHLPRAFKREHGSVNRPAFMQAYFRVVFDDDGHLLDNPDVFAIKHIRQTMFMFYKLAVPFSRDAEERVISSFVSTELELQSFSVPISDVNDLASWIIEDIFLDFDPKDIRPKHGPGAVATGERLDQKWTFSRYYSDLHREYPFSQFMRTNFDHTLDSWDEMDSLERRESGVAKVVLVPKDSRGPRLISCEPLEYQFIQQGLGRKIVDWLENHPLTSGRVNFSSQQINRDLALISSVDKSYSTLDLKDASDRNSLDLMRYLFSSRIDIIRCLESCRTTATRLPDGSVVPLKKFAPMGSACCFPIEAISFWAICVAARCVAERLTVSDVAASTFVYGDDIIIPTHSAEVVIQALSNAGLIVNVDKSCIIGNFRESCGMDAFAGIEVTPTRVRTLWSDLASDGSAYTSYASYMNNLFMKGYEKCFDFLKGALERVYGVMPFGTAESPFPNINIPCPCAADGLNSLLPIKYRYNASLQRDEFRVRFVPPSRVQTELDSWERLLRNLLSGELVDPTTVVLPYSTRIKYGWKSV